MADRYWVGGSGNWTTTDTTHWSASSGGAGGASVPTSADNVFFDQAGPYTVTMGGSLQTLNCLDFTVSGGSITFTYAASHNFYVYGSFTLAATTVWNQTFGISFQATTTGKTITTNGVTTPVVFSFDGVGGGWTLGSALNLSTSAITVTRGTFDTGGYSINANAIISTNTNARTITLGSSTITLVGAQPIDFLTPTNLTLNAGTSQINVSSTTAEFRAGGKTFYNLSYTSTAAGVKSLYNVGFTSTFNNITVAGPSTAGVSTLTFTSNVVINGTLSTTGTAGNRRVFFASDTYGIGRTLTVNSAPSLTDADFRDIYVDGTAAPISGTRIGNRGNCTGITFNVAKTVYWNLTGSQQWSSNGWASTSGGTPSTDNFPLPQDTAVIDNNAAGNGISLFGPTFPYVSTVDLSARTTAFSVSTSSTVTCYGNWTNGSGTSLINSGGITFSGGSTQTITSAGKTFSGPITVDTYGGTVQLADALDIGSNTLTVTNGTFNTQGFAVTASSLSSTNSNVRAIYFGASTITFSTTGNFINFAATTNLTFNAGTSTIISNGLSGGLSSGGLTFYNVAMATAATAGYIYTITGSNTFNNLTITAPSAAGAVIVTANANQTINGTLTCAGASAVRRIFVRSDTLGTQRTLTVNSISANDCDFRDIVLAGAAAGASPTRAGDCGNNSGITFPAPKTVYWNLAGGQSWNATAWATSSGGVPDVNNFPLAQDTAVFDNAGAAGTVFLNIAYGNVGTVDASARTSAMTLNFGNPNYVYGDWKFGTGVATAGSTYNLYFIKKGIQTITSNGVTFKCHVNIENPQGTVQLADALALDTINTLYINQATFNAATYNVTTGTVSNLSTLSTLKMGSGTWTLSGTGTVWNCTTAPTIYSGTATIVLSDTSTSARTFNGGGLYYNKLTIGGTTGTSTLTITGNNTFGELASTKTVAHTIAFGTTVQGFGKWSVTGTVGNVVTLTGTSTTSNIYGPAVTGIDYLAMGTWGISTTSPGEFYAGANSTGTAAAPVYRTAAPAPRTLYWVGGSGNWSDTTHWSTSSGGASGAAVPTSLDAVIADSASGGTFALSVNAFNPMNRCASIALSTTPFSTLTLGGTGALAIHGNVTFAATGVSITYTGAMSLAGNSSYTFRTNGLQLASVITVNGIGSTWSLGSALSIANSAAYFAVQYGSFSTSASNYALTCSALSSSTVGVRSISLNASTVTLSTPLTPVNFGTGADAYSPDLTFNAGTSQITCTSFLSAFYGGSKTFYDVSTTSGSVNNIAFYGQNTFRNLSIAGLTNGQINDISFSADQTITGTLTLSVGLVGYYRTFLRSSVLGTPRTLTCAAVSFTDADFRDITIAGAAAPASGTRLGNCGGNSGITFPAPKTVYFASIATTNWGTNSWAPTSGGAANPIYFPLAQDTAVFPATYPTSGSTVTLNMSYNIGTINMSLRTANTMTLSVTNSQTIYGNWINGTGVTLSGAGLVTFAGRSSQTITSAGKTFTQGISIQSPGGSVTLQDGFTSSSSSSYALGLFNGTFNANNYNVTFSGAPTYAVQVSGTTPTIAMGSGAWTISTAWNMVATAPTITGSATISMTSATSKTFTGGGFSYSGITLNQGGAGTLTISGNNTFANITNTYSATGASTINLGSTTQTVGAFTATGTAGKLLTITGISAAGPATLVYTGAGSLSGVGYLNTNFIRAYPTTSTWAVTNSTNGGSLGFSFSSLTPAYTAGGQFIAFF